MNKDLLILERSSSELTFKSDGGAYVLEGIFGELDKKNRNNRIYSAEEYLPQIEALQDKIKASKLLGELDHPQNFDVSLKNVSHIIEEITYDKENKQIRGRIRLLDTDAGRQAKALVDAGVPLQISSRAAGAVESNGQVKIKQLFTYDLVADPGFENAELKRVNESFGFANDDSIQIFEVPGKADLLENIETIKNKENNTMAESKFISVEDFNKYSQYLAEEIKSLKEAMESATNNETAQEISNLKEYATYLAEKLDQSIQYSEHVAEKTDQAISYAEHVAEKVDSNISYSEHIAEGVNQIKEYTNYLAEAYNEGATTHENLLKYVDYLKENLQSVTEYAEYVAETVNSNLLLEDEAGLPAEELEDETKVVDSDVEEPVNVEKDLELEGEGDAAGEEITEEAGEEAGLPAEDLKDETKEVDNDVEEPVNVEKDLELEGEGDAAGEEIAEGNAFGDAVRKAKEAGEEEFEFDGKTYKVEEEAEAAEAVVESCGECGQEPCVCEKKEDAMEAYKNEITEKLQALINKATEKKNDNPHFFRFVSESVQAEYSELATEDKSKVLSAVEGKGYLTEGQILGLWKNALIVDAPVAGQPNVLTMMPAEYKETWAKLSESKKSQILAQSKYHKLDTPYQVANFWQTRDLREVAPIMEKIAMVKESKEETKQLPYDLTSVAEDLKKRFNR
jgi:methyl-accepting chemotaxis protein